MIVTFDLLRTLLRMRAYEQTVIREAVKPGLDYGLDYGLDSGLKSDLLLLRSFSKPSRCMQQC